MTTRRKRQALALVLFAGLVGMIGAASLILPRQADAVDRADPKPKQPAATPADKDDHAADRAAIQAQMEGFLKAFEGGDAEQVASYWTENGELIGGEGGTFRGRAAIAKAYRAVLAAKGKRHAEVERDSLRFPSADTAVDEGYFKVSVDGREPTTNRYSVLHVREGGKWRMAIVREWPAEKASLHDLEWLIGSWAAKSDDGEVHTTYEWMWDKSFIRVQFTIRQKGQTLTGFQMIGRDAATGELRSWTFESEGGFGEATWSRDGKRWVLESAGRLADGRTLAATNIMVPLDHDTFTWQAAKRSIDGDEVEDLPPVKVTRVKPSK